MYDHTFSKLANHQIRHQATHVHKVGCQAGHLNLPQGFVWLCIWEHTHFITPEDGSLGKIEGDII